MNLFKIELEVAEGRSCLVLDESLLRAMHPNLTIEELWCNYQEIRRNTTASVIDESYELGAMKTFTPTRVCPPEDYVYIKCTAPRFAKGLLYKQLALLPRVRTSGSENNLQRKGGFLPFSVANRE